MSRPFVKMNGLGNDFVVVEAASRPFTPSRDEARAIADRASGVGCDQLIGLERSGVADIFMRIWNADGGEAEACGNATRCVAWLLLQATGRESVRIETLAGVLEATAAGAGAVTVDMGAPGLDWRDIPLAGPADTRELDLRVEAANGGPGCVSMGNPHVVFFVADVEATPVAALGAWLEHHRRFPQKANIGFAQIQGPDRIRLRVWERGVGVTLACGTGACAALVAAHRRDLTGRAATVQMDGGPLEIQWRESDGHVLMTGPASIDFIGRLTELEMAA